LTHWNLTDDYGNNQNGVFNLTALTNGTFNFTLNVSNYIMPWSLTDREYFLTTTVGNSNGTSVSNYSKVVVPNSCLHVPTLSLNIDPKIV
jgi:hypothetical protein